jgi:hypothetical protein
MRDKVHSRKIEKKIFRGLQRPGTREGQNGSELLALVRGSNRGNLSSLWEVASSPRRDSVNILHTTASQNVSEDVTSNAVTILRLAHLETVWGSTRCTCRG